MKRAHTLAFSLAETVVALGICAFVIVAMIGLFSVGLKASRDSYNQVQVAGLASQIISTRNASPSSDAFVTDATTLPIKASQLASAYQQIHGGTADTKCVDHNGYLVDANDTSAVYRITCFSGTSTLSGAYLSQVYMMLSWPPKVSPDLAEGKYETTTFISLR